MRMRSLKNIKLAKELGYKFVEPVVGHLACNDTGKGKLADVQDKYRVCH